MAFLEIPQQAIHQHTFSFQQGIASNLLVALGGGGGSIMGGSPSEHFGMVKTFRKKFKEYTKEEFRHISNQPMIKHILIGMTELNKEQIADRIKEHLEE